MLVAGIDAGSRAIKVAVYDTVRGAVVAEALGNQGIAQESLAEAVLAEALANGGVKRDRVARIVATGYGRHSLNMADTAITEITCHATGVHRLMPGARTVIEVGGQDSKMLRLDGRGKVQDFAMNDRCAAGTGRFLEVLSERLETPLRDLGMLAASSAEPAAISSMCVVFAETEIIGLLASGVSRADIAAGVQNSMARRVAALMGRSIPEPIVFTGGVALVPGMAEALADALGRPVDVVPNPQMTGALGAAILAANGSK